MAELVISVPECWLKLAFEWQVGYLLIQASSVSCERVFSSNKETITARRNQISGDLMEQLQILKFLIKKGWGLDFTYGTYQEDEVAELEEVINAQNGLPEDLHSYLA